MLFDVASEFISLDNRRLRDHYTTTVQSLEHKLTAQLPKSIIENKTILDLGSCLGAAGYYSLVNGAAHYTGIELQDYYYDTSVSLLGKYFDTSKFQIVKEDILTNLASSDKKYDVVLAAGILYQFLDPINFLNLISNASSKHLIIDTRYVPKTTPGTDTGLILINRKERMVKAVDADTHDYFEGIGSRISEDAIDIILNTKGFELEEKPKVTPITDTSDPYNTMITYRNGIVAPPNFIVRYVKTNSIQPTLNDLLNGKLSIS